MSFITETTNLQEVKLLVCNNDNWDRYSYRAMIFTKEEHPQLIHSFGGTNGSTYAHTYILMDEINQAIEKKAKAGGGFANIAPGLITNKENVQLILMLTPFLYG